MKAKISQNAGRGKKFDSVFYDVEQVVSDDGGGKDRKVFRKVQIDLYLQKKFDTNPDAPPPAATVDMAFLAFCEETKDQAFGTDVSAVLKMVRSKLDERHRIAWERYFLVKVDPSSIYDGTGEGLTLSWHDVERGVAFDGSVLLKRYNRYGTWSNKWVVEPWPKVVKENGKIVATINGTAENEEALRVFAKKIAEMRKALAAMVAPDAIEATLDQIAGSQLTALIGGSRD